MTTKTKTAIASGVAAVGIATASLMGLNTTEETIVETTPIVETVEEIETIDVSIPEQVEETEPISNLETTTETDPLAPYRRAIEKDGILIYYYEGVPPDLMPLLIQKPYSNFSLRGEPVTVADSDLSIVDNYIFVQTANGMLYLSQLSHGIVTDERITTADLSGYMVYLNQSIECYEWLPFKTFAGTFYGNGNSMYVMSIAEGEVTLTIDNAFADNFSGEMQDLTIVCNSELTPFITTAKGGKFTNVDFSGAVTYLIENAENCIFDDCGIYISCRAVVKNATAVTVKNTVIENEMKIALFEVAEGECVIENNIIASIIQGEPESNCGAFVGTLKNEIVLKNNLSQCVIDVPIGYGGHAIGYADYDYQPTENIFGNYFESSLTVEGEESDLFIGNIDFVKITASLESIEAPELLPYFINEDGGIAINPLYGCGYMSGNVCVTTYNLALFPDYVYWEENGLTKEEAEVLYQKNVQAFSEYKKKVEALKQLEQFKSSYYEGFYTEIDLSALNQSNDKNIYEEDGKYYFEVEELPDTLTITNAVYSDGSVIVFFNQTVTNKTAIVTTMTEENKIITMSLTDITGKTCFVSVPNAEEISRVKIMVWEDVGSMKPACEAYEIEVIPNAE